MESQKLEGADSQNIKLRDWKVALGFDTANKLEGIFEKNFKLE